jgi:hypothetical protein
MRRIFLIVGAAALLFAPAEAQISSGSAGSSPSNPSYKPVPSSIVTGQAIIAVTGTAVQLPANTLVNGVVVKAKGTNNAACGTVGPSSVTNAYAGAGNGYGVCPGEASSFATNNTSNVWVNGTAGDIFTFEGN